MPLRGTISNENRLFQVSLSGMGQARPTILVNAGTRCGGGQQMPFWQADARRTPCPYAAVHAWVGHGSNGGIMVVRRRQVGSPFDLVPELRASPTKMACARCLCARHQTVISLPYYPGLRSPGLINIPREASRTDGRIVGRGFRFAVRSGLRCGTPRSQVACRTGRGCGGRTGLVGYRCFACSGRRRRCGILTCWRVRVRTAALA